MKSDSHRHRLVITKTYQHAASAGSVSTPTGTYSHSDYTYRSESQRCIKGKLEVWKNSVRREDVTGIYKCMKSTNIDTHIYPTSTSQLPNDSSPVRSSVSLRTATWSCWESLIKQYNNPIQEQPHQAKHEISVRVCFTEQAAPQGRSVFDYKELVRLHYDM